MDIREMRTRLGDTQSEFAARYNIPVRTVQNWETGMRRPPEYITALLESRIKTDLVNRKTAVLPKYSSQKLDLPKRSDYIGATAWLKAVRDCIGEPVVFALDDAIMCLGCLGGLFDVFVFWFSGRDSVTRFNGVAVLGNQISPYYVESKNGVDYTNFNRTLSDALANESILDMQGITEALSRYYYRNGNSFNGIFVAPEYQAQFEKLADEAINYYEN